MVYVLKGGKKVGVLRQSDLTLRRCTDPELQKLWDSWERAGEVPQGGECRPLPWAKRNFVVLAAELWNYGNFELGFTVKPR